MPKKTKLLIMVRKCLHKFIYSLTYLSTIIRYFSVSIRPTIYHINRLTFADFNQADRKFANDNVADKQCCAMAVSSIIHSTLQPIFTWNATVMNKILDEGDSLYRKVVKKSRPGAIMSDGYLKVTHFDVVRNNIEIFQQTFALQYDSCSKIYGFLQDEQNEMRTSFTLIEGLQKLFREHSAGVLISRPRSFAVFKESDKQFYFFDSHSCEFDGKPTFADGKSSLIGCSTIENLDQICRRQIGVINQTTQYTLDYIKVLKLTSASDRRYVINADFHQGDDRIFQEDMNVQCCAMAIGSIIYAAVNHLPLEWNNIDLDEILTESHELYQTVRLLNERQKKINYQTRSGHLLVKEFDVIANGFSMFNKNMELNFNAADHNDRISGKILDSENIHDLSKTVIQGLAELFKDHSAGVFTCNNRAFAVMYYVSYFFFDSHSCYNSGAPVPNNQNYNGKACLIKCNSLEELALICKRQSDVIIENHRAHSQSFSYTLDFIDVQLHESLRENIKYIKIQSSGELTF